MAGITDIVVIGSTGLIGAELVRRAGCIGLSRGEVDLTASSGSLASYVDGKAVIIAASKVPVPDDSGPDFQANLNMLRPLLDASPKFVCYLSTDALYPYDLVVTEATPPDPTTAYAKMHLAREHALQAKFRDRMLILRMSQIYGAADRHNAYGPMRMLRQAQAGEPIQLFGQGEERRDHIYVRDAAQGILDLTGMGHSGLLNLATGNSMPFIDIARTIANLMPCKIVHLPRRQAITHRDLDTSALQRALPGFMPRRLAEGLQETIQGISGHE